MAILLTLLPLLLLTMVSVALAWRLFRRFGRSARVLAALVWAQIAFVPLIVFWFGDGSPAAMATDVLIPSAVVVAAAAGSYVVFMMETGEHGARP